MTAASSTAPSVPASATARAWLDRLHALQTLRAQFADAPDLQRWAIQSRVLQFLLNTHAADPSLDERPLPTPPGEPWVNLFPGAGTAPRGAAVIRAVLQTIAEGNEEVHRRRAAEAQHEADERLAAEARSIASLDAPDLQQLLALRRRAAEAQHGAEERRAAEALSIANLYATGNQHVPALRRQAAEKAEALERLIALAQQYDAALPPGKDRSREEAFRQLQAEIRARKAATSAAPRSPEGCA